MLYRRARLSAVTVIVSAALAFSACTASRSNIQGSRSKSSNEYPLIESSIETQLVAYVEAQVALAADDFRLAKYALSEMLPLSDETLKPLVSLAASADDIDTMRARFKPLSEQVASKALPVGYAKAYCPMYDGGANWVQKNGPVRNPYFGAAMLTCGVIDAAPGAHMNHSPKHGGVVFMAPDSFHHIEGTYPADRIFRLYATDNYRQPVDVSSWSGRVIIEEVYDPDTDEFFEVNAFNLVPTSDGSFLEALIDSVELPGEFIAKVQFGDFPEERFDFLFSKFSSLSNKGSEGVDSPDSIPLAERVRPIIPSLTINVISELVERNEAVRSLIKEGRFTEIFIPALQAKELGLALMEREDEISLAARNKARISIRHLVRASYLLDWYGDLGNRQQVAGAFDIFDDAIQSIVSAYEIIQ